MQQNSLISISTFTALHIIHFLKSMDLHIAQKSKLLGQMELPSMVREGASGTQTLGKGFILPSY